MLLKMSPSASIAVTYFGLSLFSCFVLLRLIAWLSMVVGLQVHSQTKAVLTCFTLFGIWVIVPRLALDILGTSYSSIISKLSPVSLPYALEEFLNNGWQQTNYYARRRDAEQSPYLLWAMVTLLFYGGAGLLVRFIVRSAAGRLLQRRDAGTAISPERIIDDINDNSDLRKSAL